MPVPFAFAPVTRRARPLGGARARGRVPVCSVYPYGLTRLGARV